MPHGPNSWLSGFCAVSTAIAAIIKIAHAANIAHAHHSDLNALFLSSETLLR